MASSNTSNSPPQLELTLPPNTTSFKRSFDEYGFDLESPLTGRPETAGQSSSNNNGNNASTSTDGNDRNKRARSASTVPENPRPSSSLPSPPLPPISILADLDIEMSGPDDNDVVVPRETLTAAPPVLDVPAVSNQSDQYRLSLERFANFEEHIAAIRAPSSAERLPTPPPVLPPLLLPSSEEAEEVEETDVILQHSSPPRLTLPPLPELYTSELPNINVWRFTDDEGSDGQYLTTTLFASAASAFNLPTTHPHEATEGLTSAQEVLQGNDESMRQLRFGINRNWSPGAPGAPEARPASRGRQRPAAPHAALPRRSLLGSNRADSETLWAPPSTSNDRRPQPEFYRAPTPPAHTSTTRFRPFTPFSRIAEQHVGTARAISDPLATSRTTNGPRMPPDSPSALEYASVPGLFSSASRPDAVRENTPSSARAEAESSSTSSGDWIHVPPHRPETVTAQRTTMNDASADVPSDIHLPLPEMVFEDFYHGSATTSSLYGWTPGAQHSADEESRGRLRAAVERQTRSREALRESTQRLNDMVPLFRDHLNSALEPLRTPSPLLPHFDSNQERRTHDTRRELDGMRTSFELSSSSGVGNTHTWEIRSALPSIPRTADEWDLGRWVTDEQDAVGSSSAFAPRDGELRSRRSRASSLDRRPLRSSPSISDIIERSSAERLRLETSISALVETLDDSRSAIARSRNSDLMNDGRVGSLPPIIDAPPLHRPDVPRDDPSWDAASDYDFVNPLDTTLGSRSEYRPLSLQVPHAPFSSEFDFLDAHVDNVNRNEAELRPRDSEDFRGLMPSRLQQVQALAVRREALASQQREVEEMLSLYHRQAASARANTSTTAVERARLSAGDRGLFHRTFEQTEEQRNSGGNPYPDTSTNRQHRPFQRSDMGSSLRRDRPAFDALTASLARRYRRTLPEDISMDEDDERLSRVADVSARTRSPPLQSNTYRNSSVIAGATSRRASPHSITHLHDTLSLPTRTPLSNSTSLVAEHAAERRRRLDNVNMGLARAQMRTQELEREIEASRDRIANARTAFDRGDSLQTRHAERPTRSDTHATASSTRSISPTRIAEFMEHSLGADDMDGIEEYETRHPIRRLPRRRSSFFAPALHRESEQPSSHHTARLPSLPRLGQGSLFDDPPEYMQSESEASAVHEEPARPTRSSDDPSSNPVAAMGAGPMRDTIERLLASRANRNQRNESQTTRRPTLPSLRDLPATESSRPQVYSDLPPLLQSSTRHPRIESRVAENPWPSYHDSPTSLAHLNAANTRLVPRQPQSARFLQADFHFTPRGRNEQRALESPPPSQPTTVDSAGDVLMDSSQRTRDVPSLPRVSGNSGSFDQRMRLIERRRRIDEAERSRNELSRQFDEAYRPTSSSERSMQTRIRAEYLADMESAGLSRRRFGDYIRDEDFDASYDNLISLASTLGEVKPRATPQSVVNGLPSGVYSDWATENSDKRCPICLDDYGPNDAVLKLTDCSHWLHKPCLEQWLKGANSCPVCRHNVGPVSSGPIPVPFPRVRRMPQAFPRHGRLGLLPPLSSSSSSAFSPTVFTPPPRPEEPRGFAPSASATATPTSTPTATTRQTRQPSHYEGLWRASRGRRRLAELGTTTPSVPIPGPSGSRDDEDGDDNAIPGTFASWLQSRRT